MQAKETEILDFGPIYFETDFSRLLVEPWNAFSSLSFIFVAVLIYFRFKNKEKAGFFLYWAIPLLVLGGIGSTLFHAFRNHVFFILLDVVPISLLSLSIGIYQIYLLLRKAIWVVLLSLFFVFLRQLPFILIEGQAAINISYIISGLFFLLPSFILLQKTGFTGKKQVFWAVFFFMLGIFFRYYDDFPNQFLPMGVHWLWHISTAAGTWFMALFLLKIKENIQKQRIINH